MCMNGACVWLISLFVVTSIQSLHAISMVECGAIVEEQYSFDEAKTVGAQSNVWFQNGFIMSVTRSIFCGITVPVSGVINLNNSTYPLQLQNTLTLGNGAQLINGGVIDGIETYSICLLDDMVYAGSRLTLQNITIESSDRTLTLASNATLVIPDGMYLEFKNITVLLRKGASIEMQGVTSTLVLSNARFIFEDDYRFSQGSLEISGNTYFEGNTAHNIVYVSNGTLCIKSLSSLSIGRGMTLRYECATNDRLFFTDRTSVLCFKESFLVVAHTTLLLTKGTIMVRRAGIFQTEGAASKIMYQEGLDMHAIYFERNPNMVRGDEYGNITYARWDS